MNRLELRHRQLMRDTVRFDLESLTDIGVECLHFETVSDPGNRLPSDRFIKDVQPVLDGLTRIRNAFLSSGFLRFLTDGNGLAFLVFTMRVGDNLFQFSDPFLGEALYFSVKSGESSSINDSTCLRQRRTVPSPTFHKFASERRWFSAGISGAAGIGNTRTRRSRSVNASPIPGFEATSNLKLSS